MGEFFIDLAKSFFTAFAHAVTEYPLPTAIVFSVSYFVYWPQIGNKYEDDLLLAALIQFVATTIVANVTGWIFNATLNVVNIIFGITSASVSIFADHPIELISYTILWSFICVCILLQHAKWRYSDVSRLLFLTLLIPVLWVSYISANIHVHIVGAKKTDAPAIESKK